MAMLPWVAKDAEVASPPNNHWSFSASSTERSATSIPFNTDAGNGVAAGANCERHRLSCGRSKDAYQPLLDDTTTPVLADRLASIATSGPRPWQRPSEERSTSTIWTTKSIFGAHAPDIHPNPTTFQELRDIYLTEARALKGWDPAAIRLGPVSCCWYFYWRSATGASDTTSHGGVDFLPWWLNEVAWSDPGSGQPGARHFRHSCLSRCRQTG